MGYSVDCLGADMMITSIELALECVEKDKEALAAAKAEGREAQAELLGNLLREYSLRLDLEEGDGFEAVIDPYEVMELYSADQKLLEDIAPAMLDGSYVVFHELYGDSFKLSYCDGKAFYGGIDYSRA